jgi:murein DD-endopeptidase MepM/ murein hydrolase activator NlpD
MQDGAPRRMLDRHPKPMEGIMPSTVTGVGGGVHRTLEVASPLLEGRDVKALQVAVNKRLRARNLSTIATDGAYGPVTHQAALDVAWILGLSTSVASHQPLPKFRQRLIRNPAQRTPTQLARARARKGRPVPGSVARPLPTRARSGSEFGLPDAEGAPSNSGQRFHAAKDWFADGHTRVKAPVGGKVILAFRTDDVHGQVFGGTVKIQAADGKVWVLRHTTPTVNVGQRVHAGEFVAKVTAWEDGPPHVHFEVWKTRNNDVQRFENMIDPMTFFRRFA